MKNQHLLQMGNQADPAVVAAAAAIAATRPAPPPPQQAPANNGQGRPEGSRKMEISEFKNKNMNELVEMALSLGVENPAISKSRRLFSPFCRNSS